MTEQQPRPTVNELVVKEYNNVEVKTSSRRFEGGWRVTAQITAACGYGIAFGKIDVTEESEVDGAAMKMVGELRVKALRALPALVAFHVAKQKQEAHHE